MEEEIALFIANIIGRVREVDVNGRVYLVANATLIVSGVLPGSKGALLYPPSEIGKNYDAWNGIPIVVNHPTVNGMHVSARDPNILAQYGIGHVYKAQFRRNKLVAEAWFDKEATGRVDNRILTLLQSGKGIELSTGLFTDNHIAPTDNGKNPTHNGKEYTHIARNYRPDHLAILPDDKGACSINDGCGVNVENKECVLEDGVCVNCGGEGGEKGPCPEHKGKEDHSDIHPEVVSFIRQLKSSPHAPETAQQANQAAQDHHFNREAVRKAFPKKGKEQGHKRFGKAVEEAWHRVTANSCVIEDGVCVNCGGEGGTPGPCPEHKGKDREQKQIHEASREAHKATEETHEKGSKRRGSLKEASKQTLDSSADGNHEQASLGHRTLASRHEELAGKYDGTDLGKKHEKAAKAHKLAASLHHDRHLETNSNPTSNSQEKQMNRNATIKWIVTNCSCYKGAKAKEALEMLTNEELAAIKQKEETFKENEAVVNAVKQRYGEALTVNELTEQVNNYEEEEEEEKPKLKKGKKGGVVGNKKKEEEEEEEPKPTRNKKLSVEEWLEGSPEEFRALVENGLKASNREKDRLIGILVSNVEDETEKKRLTANFRKKKIEELEDLVLLIPQRRNGYTANVDDDSEDWVPSNRRGGLFVGNGAAVPPRRQTEDHGGLLPPPTSNWDVDVDDDNDD